jgi:hypothetical protein
LLIILEEVTTMKKFIFCLTVAVFLSVSVPLRAMDITVGASTWYSWWDMEGKVDNVELEMDPALLYGPALAIKINDNFGFNMIFLYGEFEGEYIADTQSPLGKVSLSTNTKRYDSDTSITYRLTDYVKVFGGLKYMGYEMKGDGNALIYQPPFTVENSAYGPAAGLSFVIPLAQNFYLLANGSGLYLWGSSKNDQSVNTDASCYGFNSTSSIAYYIAPASVTLSIGGRYQYFEWNTDEDNGTESDHAFYGITAAATYTFSI